MTASAPRQPRHRIGLAAAALSIAALGLAGCSAPSAAQTESQACESVQASLNEISNVTAEKAEEYQQDPNKAIAASKEAIETLRATAAGLGNEAVKKATAATADAQAGYVALIEDADGDATKIDAAKAETVTQELMDASSALNDLCTLEDPSGSNPAPSN